MNAEAKSDSAKKPEFGIILIGRNEGERLRMCLESVAGAEVPVVYVDSNSTDGSQDLAKSMGVTVVDLDMSIPFTAARARNAGFERLLADHPELEFVQFIDGDCEVKPGWFELALHTLQGDRSVAAVCGQRIERFPNASIFNTICNIEWNTPLGEAHEFGGDVMMRVSAFREVGGYNPSVIAAEDTDTSIRMRKLGWRILRIDYVMTVHDAAIHEFGQWWRRQVRGGHGTAENQAMHGDSPYFHRKGWVRSTMVWGLAMPAGAALMALPTLGLSAWGLGAGYSALYLKTEIAARQQGMNSREARSWAALCTLGKIPEALGTLRYWRNRLTNKTSTIIEYK